MDDSKKNFNNFHDAYLRQYIQQADTKVSWLFAVNSAILIWLIGNEPFRAVILRGNQSFISVMTVFSVLALIVSCGFLFDAIRPRAVFTERRGVVYFHHVENHPTEDDYVAHVEGLTDTDIFRERLRAQYAMSKVCSVKYRRLYAATLLAFSSFTIVIGLHLWISFAV